MKHSPLCASRTILFGSEQGFSSAVLEKLLAAGMNIIAIVMLEDRAECGDIPVRLAHEAVAGSLTLRATRHKIDIIRVSRLSDLAFHNRLRGLHADLLLVACFAHKLPPTIWREMGLPCWNLHPSLLPAYRGPSPLYWQIRNAEPNTGVSLHEVSASIDAGDLVACKRVPLPLRRDSSALDQWVAEHGMELICQALRAFCDGTLKTSAQDEARASYYPN